MKYFKKDATARWSCRDGDFVIWGRCKGLLSAPNEAFEISDVWRLRDGDYITITNRLADLPPWFELHPLETAGRIAYQVLENLKSKRGPAEPIDAPNLWRVCAGDRVVWVGTQRHDIEGNDGVVELFEFGENALIYGESTRLNSKLEMFGTFNSSEEMQESIQHARKAWITLSAKGMPRSLSDGAWRLG